MKRRRILGIIAPALITQVTTGCVSVTKVSHEDAPRTSVQFESLIASVTFYDALLWKKFPGAGKESKLLVGQTFYTRENRPSANLVFNAGAAAADADGDGVILESEAEAFARSSPGKQ